jgi:hypothetical protein
VVEFGFLDEKTIVNIEVHSREISIRTMISSSTSGNPHAYYIVMDACCAEGMLLGEPEVYQQ